MKYLPVLVIVFATLTAADDEWKPVSDRKGLQKIYIDCAIGLGEGSEPNDVILCYVTNVGVFTEDKGYILERVVAQAGILLDNVEGVRDIIVDCVKDTDKNGTAAERAFRGLDCLSNSKIGDMLNS